MANQLSSKEKRRLSRYFRNVERISKISNPEVNARFIRRQQIKAIFRTLGCNNPTKIMIGDALVIITDWKPFKLFRLRRLIRNNEREQNPSITS